MTDFPFLRQVDNDRVAKAATMLAKVWVKTLNGACTQMLRWCREGRPERTEKEKWEGGEKKREGGKHQRTPSP